MTSITIRNVDEEIIRNLKVRAARHGRTMAAEVREILRGFARDTPRFDHESYPPVALEREGMRAIDPEAPPVTDWKTPLAMAQEIPLVTNSDELIAGLNRQLEKMGLSEFALPVNPPLE